MMEPSADRREAVPDNPPCGGPTPGVSRRAFLKAGLAGAFLAALGGRWRSLRRALAQTSPQYAMVIDLNKCVGCRTCEEACRLRNNLAEGKSYIRVLPKGEGAARYFLPVQCQHCEEAPCERVCPTAATYHHDSGVVLVNGKTCVGCHYCAVACPYGARTFDEETGLVEKCWLCLDWALGGGRPACVQACVLGARVFGRRDDPEIAALLASGRTQPLHPEFGTKPGIVSYIWPGT